MSLRNSGPAGEFHNSVARIQMTLNTKLRPWRIKTRKATSWRLALGDADRWQRIVKNLGAMVHRLDRSLVPEIESAVGLSPEWYQPEERRIRWLAM